MHSFFCSEEVVPLEFVLTIGTATQEEIFTSAFASAAYLKNVLKFPEDKKVYVIGEKGIEDELDDVGIKRAGGTVSPRANQREMSRAG